MTKFSIIVPVFNAEKYLEEALHSIENQSYRNFEVFIIDDGSTDESFKIAKDFEIKDSRFHVQSIFHSGLSIARNTGISHASGDYTIFVDADDELSPELLSKVNEIIERDSSPEIIKFSAEYVPIYFMDHYRHNFIGPDFSNLSGYEALEAFLDSSSFFLTAWGYAIKTSYLKEHSFKFAPGKIYEGFRFVPEILFSAKAVSSTSYVGYFYIQREGSISANRAPENEYKKALDCISHYDFLIALIRLSELPQGLESKYKAYLEERMLARAKTLSPQHEVNYLDFLRGRGLYSKNRNCM